MANTFNKTSWMAKETLRHLENQVTTLKYVNKRYAPEYTRQEFSPGTTISIPKPARFAVTTGRVASFPDVTEESVNLTVSQKNASFAPTSLELTTETQKSDFSERYLKPMANALASAVDQDLLALAITTVYNAVGTPGTVPTALSTYLQGKAILAENLMPVDDMLANVIEPQAEANIIDALKGVFHSTSEVEKQYREGKMGLAIGAKWSMDQLVASRTVGPLGGTPLVNGASQVGAALVTDGWTAAAAARLKAGDIFTIAGVYNVNAITKQTTGRLKQFVVTADVSSDGSGNLTAAISPAIVVSGTTQNVTGSPADNAAITVLGTAGTAGKVNVMFHRDAFTLACVPLVTYAGLDKSYTQYDADTGISIRITQGMDVTNDKLLVRGDIVYGVAATRPEWACRIEG